MALNIIWKTIDSKDVKHQIPCTKQNDVFVQNSRNIIKNIMSDKDKRLLVVVWPCSMDHEDSLIDYAKRIQQMQENFWDTLFFVIRCYPSKPRSATGWTGILSHGEKSNKQEEWNMNDGILFTRKLFQQIIDMKLPIATEALYPDMTENYLGDLVSYSCIGSRSCNNELHGNYAAALDYAVWLKNGEAGDYTKLINFLKKAKKSKWEQFSLGDIIVETLWNNYAHIILRWTDQAGKKQINYNRETLQEINTLLEQNDMKSMIIIDCSHDNAIWDDGKKYAEQQTIVAHTVIDMIEELKNVWLDNIALKWIMIESYLYNGNQIDDLINNPCPRHGLSYTDPCLWIEETEKLIQQLYHRLRRSF